MKIFAKQVDPKKQTSPFKYTNYPDIEAWLFDENFTYVTPQFALVHKRVELANKFYRNTESQDAKSKLKQYILKNFPHVENRDYTETELCKWVQSIEDYNQGSCSLTDAVCMILNIYFHKEYVEEQLAGSYLRVILPKGSKCPATLEAITSEFFDMGTEWIVHTGPTIPNSPEDIKGAQVYCHSKVLQRIAAELAEYSGYFGDSEAEFVLYPFKGDKTTLKYKGADLICDITSYFP